MKRVIVMAGLLAAGAASAQEKGQIVADENIAKAVTGENKKPDGWDIGAELGATFSFSNSNRVVGQPDGSTIQLGVLFGANADLRAGQHEWQNSLTFNNTWSQSPQIDSFLKTVDNLELRTAYLYSLKSVPWLGPYARARLQTQVFNGWQVYGENRTFRVDGGDPQTLVAGDELDLTSAFEPLNLRQSAGAFARPWDSKTFSATFSLGVGAQEIFTSGGQVITKEDGTFDDGNGNTLANVVEVVSLNDSVQAGGELDVQLKGQTNKMFTWTFSANFLQPFYTDTDKDPTGKVLEGTELMNIEIMGKASVKLAEWASIDYVLTAKKIPLVLNDWQIQNGLLFSTSFKLL
ncbi:MAG: hypothetical protein KC613_19625 [Myxococcales bacterium]|nr:hypothetical protein [Myxococcales bacterium]MCB9522511.1 hypothetical protein [Myxococcales bacterium]